MKLATLLLLCFSFLAPLLAHANEYRHWRAYSIRVETADEYAALEERFAAYHTRLGKRGFEVIVPPPWNAHLPKGARWISKEINEKIEIGDESRPYKRPEAGEPPDYNWFDSYHEYEDHLDFWDDLVAAFPNNSRKVDLGKSYESRSIFAYNIWGDDPDAPTPGREHLDRPVILWHATAHGRDWISTMVVEYLAHQLVTGHLDSEQTATLTLSHYDIWIVPILNPDGFVYTQTTDRLWSKNRQPRDNTTCLGTDLSRNWDMEFYNSYRLSDPWFKASSAREPCSQTYRGEEAFDSPETKAVARLSRRLSDAKGGLRSFIDFTSYGQRLLLPYGYTHSSYKLRPMHEDMATKARGLAQAIKRAPRGPDFKHGEAHNEVFYSPASSRDYHFDELGVMYSLTVQIGPASMGDGGAGWLVAPEKIARIAQQQYEGQVWYLENIH